MLGVADRKHTVFLIDFGMARRYVDSEGKLLPIRVDSVKFRGTPRYAAGETLKCIE